VLVKMMLQRVCQPKGDEISRRLEKLNIIKRMKWEWLCEDDKYI
jgi:hypothetical protein